MRLSNKLLLPILAGALTAGACEDLGTGAELGDGEARMSILLTDAPGDLEAAVVTITDIYLQGGNGNGGGGRVYLMEDVEVTTDLLDLQNTVLELVDGETIPAGRYSQLRFVISGAYIEVEKAGGGSTIYATSPSYEGLPAGAEVDGELVCPSCSQSGFKVILPGGEDDEVELDEGATQTLLVDFDVSQSFGKPAGNSGKWILKPTLKAIAAQSAASVTVRLSKETSLVLPAIGGVATTLGAFKATLTPTAGGDAKTATLSDADGDGIFEVTFASLLPGTYAVSITGPAGIGFTTEPATAPTVTVGASGNVTTTFRLLTATAS